MLVSLNGDIIQKKAAAIPAYQSGVYYGTGCFETIRAESGKLLFFDGHYSRLKSGLSYLGVVAYGVPDKQQLIKRTKELLRANGLTEEIAKIRIQCTLAEKNGYSFDDSSIVYTLITAEKSRVINKPKVLTVAKTRVIPDSCRPSSLKLCNMLHYRNAYREARNCGVDDAIMLTIDGYVSETSIANLFWKSGDSIYTPSTTCDLLPGITRNNFIHSIRNLTEFTVNEGKFGLQHLMAADSVWITNSLVEVHSVNRIKQKKFAIDAQLTTDLKAAYSSIKQAV